jgi:hypothetical protein
LFHPGQAVLENARSPEAVVKVIDVTRVPLFRVHDADCTASAVGKKPPSACMLLAKATPPGQSSDAGCDMAWYCFVVVVPPLMRSSAECCASTKICQMVLSPPT